MNCHSGTQLQFLCISIKNKIELTIIISFLKFYTKMYDTCIITVLYRYNQLQILFTPVTQNTVATDNCKGTNTFYICANAIEVLDIVTLKTSLAFTYVKNLTYRH